MNAPEGAGKPAHPPSFILPRIHYIMLHCYDTLHNIIPRIITEDITLT